MGRSPCDIMMVFARAAPGPEERPVRQLETVHMNTDSSSVTTVDAILPDPVGTASEAPAPAAFDLDDPDLYLNRELTWLGFNQRVLHEAADPRTPLLERVKFLAIVSSNLDEFFMKRIGGLMQQMRAGVQELLAGLGLSFGMNVPAA